MSAVRRRGRRWQVVTSVTEGGRRRYVCASFATEAEAVAAVVSIDAARAKERLAAACERHEALGVTLAPMDGAAYPVGPLVEHLRRLGRLDEWTADRIATALGAHPSALWASWCDDGALDDGLVGAP